MVQGVWLRGGQGLGYGWVGCMGWGKRVGIGGGLGYGMGMGRDGGGQGLGCVRCFGGMGRFGVR